MGIKAVSGGVARSWEWIQATFETVDDALIAFLQGAESITFFDPISPVRSIRLTKGATVTEDVVTKLHSVTATLAKFQDQLDRYQRLRGSGTSIQELMQDVAIDANKKSYAEGRTMLGDASGFARSALAEDASTVYSRESSKSKLIDGALGIFTQVEKVWELIAAKPGSPEHAKLLAALKAIKITKGDGSEVSVLADGAEGIPATLMEFLQLCSRAAGNPLMVFREYLKFDAGSETHRLIFNMAYLSMNIGLAKAREQMSYGEEILSRLSRLSESPIGTITDSIGKMAELFSDLSRPGGRKKLGGAIAITEGEIITSGGGNTLNTGLMQAMTVISARFGGMLEMLGLDGAKILQELEANPENSDKPKKPDLGIVKEIDGADQLVAIVDAKLMATIFQQLSADDRTRRTFSSNSRIVIDCLVKYLLTGATSPYFQQVIISTMARLSPDLFSYFVKQLEIMRLGDVESGAEIHTTRAPTSQSGIPDAQSRRLITTVRFSMNEHTADLVTQFLLEVQDAVRNNRASVVLEIPGRNPATLPVSPSTRWGEVEDFLINYAAEIGFGALGGKQVGRMVPAPGGSSSFGEAGETANNVAPTAQSSEDDIRAFLRARDRLVLVSIIRNDAGKKTGESKIHLTASMYITDINLGDGSNIGVKIETNRETLFTVTNPIMMDVKDVGKGLDPMTEALIKHYQSELASATASGSWGGYLQAKQDELVYNLGKWTSDKFIQDLRKISNRNGIGFEVTTIGMRDGREIVEAKMSWKVGTATKSITITFDWTNLAVLVKANGMTSVPAEISQFLHFDGYVPVNFKMQRDGVGNWVSTMSDLPDSSRLSRVTWAVQQAYAAVEYIHAVEEGLVQATPVSPYSTTTTAEGALSLNRFCQELRYLEASGRPSASGGIVVNVQEPTIDQATGNVIQRYQVMYSDEYGWSGRVNVKGVYTPSTNELVLTDLDSGEQIISGIFATAADFPVCPESFRRIIDKHTASSATMHTSDGYSDVYYRKIDSITTYPAQDAESGKTYGRVHFDLTLVESHLIDEDTHLDTELARYRLDMPKHPTGGSKVVIHRWSGPVSGGQWISCGTVNFGSIDSWIRQVQVLNTDAIEHGLRVVDETIVSESTSTDVMPLNAFSIYEDGEVIATGGRPQKNKIGIYTVAAGSAVQGGVATIDLTHPSANGMIAELVRLRNHFAEIRDLGLSYGSIDSELIHVGKSWSLVGSMNLPANWQMKSGINQIMTAFKLDGNWGVKSGEHFNFIEGGVARMCEIVDAFRSRFGSAIIDMEFKTGYTNAKPVLNVRCHNPTFNVETLHTDATIDLVFPNANANDYRGHTQYDTNAEDWSFEIRLREIVLIPGQNPIYIDNGYQGDRLGPAGIILSAAGRCQVDGIISVLNAIQRNGDVFAVDGCTATRVKHNNPLGYVIINGIFKDGRTMNWKVDADGTIEWVAIDSYKSALPLLGSKKITDPDPLHVRFEQAGVHVPHFIAFLSKDGTTNLGTVADVQRSGGDVDGIRFDEWLVHHVLGIAYNTMPVNYGASAALHTDLRTALERIGLVTGMDFTVDLSGAFEKLTPSGQSKIMPWHVLYAANKGNYDSGQTFLDWHQSTYGVPFASVSTAEQYARFVLWGTGLGFAIRPFP